ncbi:uncharacterized protein LOC135704050 [Ochlerotatus camptorhynchus]|uniref:uncharacterized protein LOC135704050 n=1 Tax=Ochlerotatus camptorhynchus TaxID=644619 RepID=UPI0031D4BB90
MSRRIGPQYLRSFSVGAIPFLNDSMSYRVTEDNPNDLPNVYQRSTSRVSTNGNYENNLTLPSATPVYSRSKSDLNLASSDTVSNSPTTSSGYIDPRNLEYTTTTMVPLQRLTTESMRRAASILPPIPPRSSRDYDNRLDGLAHRRANSESNNQYDISKSIAESAMDISLLTANANQLRLLITYNQGSQTYMACITFIIMSLVLQMLVAVTMIIVSLMKQNLLETTRQKLKIITSVGVAVITMINILVASLVVAETPATVISGGGGTFMRMETLPNVAASSTTAMPITMTTGSTMESMLEAGFSTVASNILANVTGMR